MFFVLAHVVVSTLSSAFELSVAFPTLSPVNRPSAASILTSLAAEAEAMTLAIGEGPSDMVDVYGESGWLSSFESEVAHSLGKERAVFLPTGVAAQNMALAVHAKLPFLNTRTEPQPSFIVHPTSHLCLHEERAYAHLLGLVALVVGEAGRPLAPLDIEKQLVRLRSVGSSPAAIVVELPQRELGCVASTWDELLEMRALADAYGVPIHLDGARLWEIAPYYAEQGHPIEELCALFDTIYVSFNKGLGGLTGAMLLGTSRHIDLALPWRRRLGANPFTLMPFAVSCCAAYRKHAATFAVRWHKLRGLAPKLREVAVTKGGYLRFVPDEPQSCQCHVHLGAGLDATALDLARDRVAEALGVRVYSRLRGDPGFRAPTAERGHYFEWTLGPAHVDVPDATYVEAWMAFFDELHSIKAGSVPVDDALIAQERQT